jgi:hypothetical protein
MKNRMKIGFGSAGGAGADPGALLPYPPPLRQEDVTVKLEVNIRAVAEPEILHGCWACVAVARAG